MEVAMAQLARTALVLQGGGALGAYELGAAKRLYQDGTFAPELIAGVSIGAITASLLARPAPGLTPLQALQAFWDEVTVSGWLYPLLLRPFASAFGNPHFFVPRSDIAAMLAWTSLYDTSPLRQTLAGLLDLKALADPKAEPGLLVNATAVEAGQVAYFYSGDDGLSLDHILASGSLPPSFPMTVVDGVAYWDGGLFDNTPLGAVLDRMIADPAADRTIYVVNLFPNKAPLPTTMAGVGERMLNLQFANRTAQDLGLMKRFDEVARLVERLESLAAGNPLKDDPAYRDVLKRAYVRSPKIVEITRTEQAGQFDGMDFSPEGIRTRAAQGYEATVKALAA
jgi:predicted acylesterase/phospholipase RssA